MHEKDFLRLMTIKFGSNIDFIKKFHFVLIGSLVFGTAKKNSINTNQICIVGRKNFHLQPFDAPGTNLSKLAFIASRTLGHCLGIVTMVWA